MRLHELKPSPGSRREGRRVGRGIAAGQGKTSGRGQKGQGARSSVGLPRTFEGGQLPLTQRLPKLRGFHNRWRKEVAVVNLGKLSGFEPGATVDGPALAERGIIAEGSARVKVLAAGRLRAPLHLRVHRVSVAARKAVEAAGGSVELLEAAPAKQEPAGAAKAAENTRRSREAPPAEDAPPAEEAQPAEGDTT
jgi:large subunit ribosomal protein L15